MDFFKVNSAESEILTLNIGQSVIFYLVTSIVPCKKIIHFSNNNHNSIMFPTRFTALGSIYFVHETWTNTVEIYDWHVSNLSTYLL